MNTFWGLLIPLAGTTLGAAGVFFMKNNISQRVQHLLFGFSAGVMVAASIWSLLIPAMTMSEHMGKLAFIPAVTGFAVGIGFLLFMERFMPVPENGGSRVTKRLVWAVMLHNLPEGMAVGVAFAGAAVQKSELALAGAFTLAVGIAIQNIPEGTIISMPLASVGTKKYKAFGMGFLSGTIEPIGALVTIALSAFVVPVLPYLLAFSAGTMMSVVVTDLVPESVNGKSATAGVLSFSLGFLIMMTLDVVLS